MPAHPKHAPPKTASVSNTITCATDWSRGSAGAYKNDAHVISTLTHWKNWKAVVRGMSLTSSDNTPSRVSITVLAQASPTPISTAAAYACAIVAAAGVGSGSPEEVFVATVALFIFESASGRRRKVTMARPPQNATRPNTNTAVGAKREKEQREGGA